MIRRVCLVVIAGLILASCQRQDPGTGGPSYVSKPRGSGALVFGVYPQRNPQELHAAFQPLVEYLDARLPGVHFVLEGARDYAAFGRKLGEVRFAFALANPYQTVSSLASYRVIGMAGSPDAFRGILLVRRDAGIRTFQDLRGRSISFPAPTALAAAMMPQALLAQNGLHRGVDYEARYVGSPESSILNVLHGDVAAGATSPAPWEAWSRTHPVEAAALTIRWSTPGLPGCGVLARRDVPAALVDKVRAVLLGMDADPLGRRILGSMGIARFNAASDASFDPVRAFVADFSQHVRPPEHP